MIPIATGSARKNLGGISFAANRYLVVWEEDGLLLGRNVAAAGTASEAFEIDPGPVGPEVALASDGERTLVLFTRPRGVGEAGVDIEGVFVGHSG